MVRLGLLLLVYFFTIVDTTFCGWSKKLKMQYNDPHILMLGEIQKRV